MASGMRIFSGKMQKEQMSGRPYLRTITGTLKRSWFVTVRTISQGIASSLKTRSKYAAIHQFGGTIKPKTKEYLHFKTDTGWVKTKAVRIPKRLDIFEAFRKRGPKIIYKSLLSALTKALKRRK